MTTYKTKHAEKDVDEGISGANAAFYPYCQSNSC